MVSPIDYTIDVVDPFQRAMQGWQRGAQMTEQDNILAAQAAEMERKKQAEIQQQAMQKDLLNFSKIPNKTAKDYSNIISRYPSLAEPYQKSWEMLDTGQRQQALSTAGQVMSAIKTNNPSVAQDILEEQAVAYDNSGDKQSALNMRRMKSMISKDPNSIYASLGFFGNAVSPEDFAPIMEKLGANAREDQKLPIEIAKIGAETGQIKAQTQGQMIENRYKPQQYQAGIAQTNSQVALNYATINNMSERMGLDRDKLETETSLKLQELNPSNIKLSDGAQKLVNDTMIASVASEQSANQQINLADRIESAGGGFGAFSRFSEWVKGQTGNQDAMTQLRNEYNRIRNSQAIKSLPPGPATDKDIDMALKGFPSDTADSGTIASFLRGMAKMNQRDAAYQQMQAEWINQVGNMGSTKRDVEVLGVKVPSGTTFGGFATKNINKALKVQASQAVDRQIATGQRSYMSAVE